MIPTQVKALHDEITKLMVSLDALEAKCARQEGLLREALTWCPRTPKHPTSAKRQAVGDGWVDLGDRIEAELGKSEQLTEGPN
jgi:hypothetical protein